MSKYTTEVRYICESKSKLPENGYFTSGKKITPQDYCAAAMQEIFDESIVNMYADIGHADVLTKILYHYYTREIAFETYYLWKTNMNRFMWEHFSEYKELYKTIDVQYDMFNDVDIKREHTGENASEISSSANNKSKQNDKSTQKFSDTPQGGLDGLESDRYMSSAQISENESAGENNGNTASSGKGNDHYVETVKGKQGSKNFSEMVIDYRKAIMNVDMRIINDISDMFFNLW
mgnify:CR=1 FL=1|jgi:hypothetical protein